MADPFAPTINVNPSPKQRFMAVKAYVDAHRELMQRPDLVRAIDNALAQMVWMQSSTMAPDGNTAAAFHFKMAGAHEFIRILRELAESPKVIPNKPGEREMIH